MVLKAQKGRRDFNARLIGYAIESGALVKCEDHPGSVYRAQQDFDMARAAVKAAWETGEISSDYESAAAQLERLIEKAPNGCSHATCWAA